MRTSRYLLSEGFMPWMRGVRWLAEQVAADRHPAAADNPFKVEEEHVVSRVAEGIEQGRRLRDALWERLFDSLYGGAGNARPVVPEHRGTIDEAPPLDTRTGLDFQAAGISRAATIGGS
ncbi:DUF3141 domain-containing protein, partial [Xanthobacter versatilis]